jgi:acyl CoA:acetate/3-ketoacid CoA transferase alpha subunit
VEELVPAGTLDPNDIHTPGIFVDRIVQVMAPSDCTSLIAPSDCAR